MKLTDEQVSTLAVCAVCQRELDNDRVRKGLEGGTPPEGVLCRECGSSEQSRAEALKIIGEAVAERHGLTGLSDEQLVVAGANAAADSIKDRCRRAGVLDQYSTVFSLLADNRQN